MTISRPRVRVERNWVGIEVHPTDEYVHWTSKDPQGEMAKLREAYDALLAQGESVTKQTQALTKQRESYLKLLLSAAYTAGGDYEHDAI